MTNCMNFSTHSNECIPISLLYTSIVTPNFSIIHNLIILGGSIFLGVIKFSRIAGGLMELYMQTLEYSLRDLDDHTAGAQLGIFEGRGSVHEKGHTKRF